MQSIIEEKKSFRLMCKQKRREMSRQQKDKADKKIFYRTSELLRRIAMPEIYTYVSSPETEVDTLSLIDYCLEKGKTIIVPRCIPGDLSLEHYIIKSRSQLEKGYYGIMEPVEADCEKVSAPHRGICIVPGLAFDAKGYRLGYGKGYYDRFLEAFSGLKIGLCYESCYFPDGIPHESFDAVMDIIVTENNIIRPESRK